MNVLSDETLSPPRRPARYLVARVPPSHYGWLRARTGVTLTEDFSAIAALDPNRLEWCRYCKQEHAAIRGMVGYSDGTPAAAYVHIALDTPLAARPLREVALPALFEVAGKSIAFAQVRSTNVRVRRLLAHRGLGFRQVAVHPSAYGPGDDIIVYRLDRADWSRNGREG